MPYAPKRPCTKPGCPRLTDTGRCTEHHKDKDRPGTAARGYDSKWRRYAKRYLRDHPLCHYCAHIGRTTAAACVDHAQPHKDDQRLLWDASNHRPACIKCNSRKGDKDELSYLARLDHDRIQSYRETDGPLEG